MLPDKIVPIESYEIDPHPNYTLFKLHTKVGTVPLYTTPDISERLFKDSSRPITHDLLHNVLLGFNLTILKCIIDHVEDSIYYAKLFLHKDNNEIISIDARPSDILILLKEQRFPLYIAQKVLDLSLPNQ